MAAAADQCARRYRGAVPAPWQLGRGTRASSAAGMMGMGTCSGKAGLGQEKGCPGATRCPGCGPLDHRACHGASLEAGGRSVGRAWCSIGVWEMGTSAAESWLYLLLAYAASSMSPGFRRQGWGKVGGPTPLPCSLSFPICTMGLVARPSPAPWLLQILWKSRLSGVAAGGQRTTGWARVCMCACTCVSVCMRVCAYVCV